MLEKEQKNNIALVLVLIALELQILETGNNI